MNHKIIGGIDDTPEMTWKAAFIKTGSELLGKVLWFRSLITDKMPQELRKWDLVKLAKAGITEKNYHRFSQALLDYALTKPDSRSYEETILTIFDTFRPNTNREFIPANSIIPHIVKALLISNFSEEMVLAAVQRTNPQEIPDLLKLLFAHGIEKRPALLETAINGTHTMNIKEVMALIPEKWLSLEKAFTPIIEDKKLLQYMLAQMNKILGIKILKDYNIPEKSMLGLLKHYNILYRRMPDISTKGQIRDYLKRQTDLYSAIMGNYLASMPDIATDIVPPEFIKNHKINTVDLYKSFLAVDRILLALYSRGIDLSETKKGEQK